MSRRRLPTLAATCPTEPWQSRVQAVPSSDDHAALTVYTTPLSASQSIFHIGKPVLVLGHPWPKWKEILRLDPCCYCGRRFGGTIEHVQPRLRGEASSILLNGAGACSNCNHDKGDTPLLVWLATSGKLRRRRAAVRLRRR